MRTEARRQQSDCSRQTRTPVVATRHALEENSRVPAWRALMVCEQRSVSSVMSLSRRHGNSFLQIATPTIAKIPEKGLGFWTEIDLRWGHLRASDRRVYLHQGVVPIFPGVVGP